MRNLIILLMVMLCSCAQLPPAEIPNAPTKQAQAVVVDIDGTLTPDVLHFNTARLNAASALRKFADKGYKIFYLSDRIKPLQGIIPNWLKKEGFPDVEGNVYVPYTDWNVFNFKKRMLQNFIANGWKIEYAYGDSPTDFRAYAAAGIPMKRVFALQRDGETECLPGAWNVCLKGWTCEHLDFITKSVQSVPAK